MGQLIYLWANPSTGTRERASSKREAVRRIREALQLCPADAEAYLYRAFPAFDVGTGRDCNYIGPSGFRLWLLKVWGFPFTRVWGFPLELYVSPIDGGLRVHHERGPIPDAVDAIGTLLKSSTDNFHSVRLYRGRLVKTIRGKA